VGIIMSYSYPERGPTADLLIEAEGETLEEVFSNIVFGMFNVITPLEGISENEEFGFEVEGNDLESLLFNLMDEFLYINDVDFLVPKTIKLEIDKVNFKIVARCVGERFSAATHEVGIAVKAVTYHLMEIKKQPCGWFVQIVFDT
jgi:SHS2 domain-containing protein